MKLRYCSLAFVLVGLTAIGLRAQDVTGRQKLYALNGGADSMTVVDVATNKILKTITVGKAPHGLASPKGHRLLYVSIEHEDEVVLVDTVRDEIVKRFKGFSRRPNEGEITPDGRVLYQPAYSLWDATQGVYDVFDTAKEQIIARIPVDGKGHNTLVSPDGRYAYLVPVGPGGPTGQLPGELPTPNTTPTDVYVVDTSTHKVIDKIPVGNGPRPAALSPDGKRMYLQTDTLLGFLVIDLDSRKVVGKATYELTPEEQARNSRSHGIAVAAGGREVWSTDVNHNVVFVYDVTVTPPRQIARLPTARSPLWATTTLDGNTVYVSCAAEDVVIAYDVATKTEKARIQFQKGQQPKRIQVLAPPSDSPSTASTR